jgi:flagellar hook assembly protein FlgD
VLVNSENTNDISIEMGDGTLYSNVNFVQHTYQQVGTYEVVVNVGNSTCIETFNTQVRVSEITKGLQSLSGNQITIFPNPVKETLNLLINIPANADVLNVNILDINGRKVYNQQINPTSGFYNVTIDLSHLSAGVYQFNVQGNDFNTVKKLIIQK